MTGSGLCAMHTRKLLRDIQRKREQVGVVQLRDANFFLVGFVVLAIEIQSLYPIQGLSEES